MSRILTRAKTLVTRRNQNYLCVIVGRTGSGKSYTAMKIAEKLDKTFNIDRVCFTAREFMNIINSGKLRKGHAIIFDEAGVGISARNWYTVINKALSYVVQTFRHRNLFVILTVPSLSFIDVHIRRLIHAIIETTSIDFEKEQVVCKYFNVQHNPTISKTYQKYPVIKKDGIVKKIKRFRVGKPSKELIDLYEKKKTEFTRLLNTDAYRSITELEKKEVSKWFNYDTTFEVLKKNFNVTDKMTVPKIINYLREKGVNIGEGRGRRLREMWRKYITDNKEECKSD